MQNTPLRPPTRTLLSILVMAALAGGCAVAPQPLSPDEQRAQASANRQALTAQQEPIQGPVTLDEAMARAVKYNLDHRVKLLQEALSERDLDLSNFDLLPKLTLQAGYTARNNVNASSSENVANGTQSLVPSTSEDKHQRSADLGFAWNVLDFGVSYYGAKQQADRVLIAQEERRKVLQLLMQQTRQAYWQAAGAQVLEDKVEPILKQAQQALDDSRKIEKENLKAPIESLNYQRQLLDIVRQLESVRDELAQAKPRLASIMNLEPGQRYSLAPPSGFAIPKVVMPVERMEETALVQRPELVQAAYTERIGVLETRKALAKLLPGVEIDLGGHYNSNSFLVNKEWADAGLRVSWNLFNLLNTKQIKRDADAQIAVARTQRLALSMAVLTQVHVAWRDFQGKQRQFELNQQLYSVEQRILEHTRNAARADAQGQLEEIRAGASTMMSELRLYQSYGAMQSAWGQLVVTLGLDPIGSKIDSNALADIEKSIDQAEQHWLVLADGAPMQ